MKLYKPTELDAIVLVITIAIAGWVGFLCYLIERAK